MKLSENFIKLRGLILDNISFSKRKVKIRLILKDGIKRPVLTLTNVFYLPYSLSNFVSLGFLNNAKIFHYNKDQILYNQEI